MNAFVCAFMCICVCHVCICVHVCVLHAQCVQSVCPDKVHGVLSVEAGTTMRYGPPLPCSWRYARNVMA